MKVTVIEEEHIDSELEQDCLAAEVERVMKRCTSANGEARTASSFAGRTQHRGIRTFLNIYRSMQGNVT